MARALSNLVNNISEGIHRVKCEYGHDDKKCKTSGIKYKHCYCFVEYTNLKNDLIESMRVKLKKQFFDTLQIF